MAKVFKVSDLKRLIRESSNEFKAKIGDGVESSDKENNGKAYRDAKKRAHDFDGGLESTVGSKHPKYSKDDWNRSLLGYNMEMPLSDKKKKDIKAQVLGYTSDMEKNNKLPKSNDYSNGENIFKGLTDFEDNVDKERVADAKKGLVGRTRPDSYYKKERMYEGNNIKTAYFKRTEFLTENDMLSRIPDNFKTEGNVFKMKDKTDSTYLIRWEDDEPIIMEHVNKKGFDDSVSRMKELFNYKSDDVETKSTAADRLNENKGFVDVLNKVRDLKDD